MCFSEKKSIVTILVPCYNEEDNLPLLMGALCNSKGCLCENHQYSFQILLVNDGSTDKTQEVIEMLSEKDDRIDYVSLSRNFGKECAMLAGFDYAKGDCIVIIDADLQDPPELIPEMIKYWEEGYEDVYARRSNRGKESLIRKTLSLSFYRLLQKSSKIDMLPNVGDFRLLDRKCIEGMKELREKERYTKGLFAWIGFKKKRNSIRTARQGKGSIGMELWKLISFSHRWNYIFHDCTIKNSDCLRNTRFISGIYLYVLCLCKSTFVGRSCNGLSINDGCYFVSRRHTVA